MKRGPQIDPQGRAIAASNKSISLSGNTYVSAVLREDEGKYPPRSYMIRLPYVADARDCDHGYTICAQWQCVESWSVDYKLNLWRTGAGREIASKLRLDLDKPLDHPNLVVLKHEDFVVDNPL